jgi:hypothetical protein
MANSTLRLMSRPADPQALSFLDLPAEIRNWIYELLFEHDGPLRIASAGGKLVVMLIQQSLVDEVLLQIQEKRPHSHYRWQTDAASVAKKDLIASLSLLRTYLPGLQLLRVCRQLCQETSSVLYSRDICIPRKLNIHAHDASGIYMSHVSTLWLRQIGQYRRFVRKLEIDLQGICPSGCHCCVAAHDFRLHDGYLEFGPLLKAIWADDLDIAITFTNSKKATNRSFNVDSQGNRFGPAVQSVYYTLNENGCIAERLTRTVQALCKDDLGLKRYRRVIGNIGVCRDGSAGVVALWTPKWKPREVQNWQGDSQEPNAFFEHAHYFNVDKEGVLQFQQKNPPHLFNLPDQIQSQIITHIINDSKERELDLDTCTNLQDLFGILYTNSSLHSMYMHPFLKATTFSLSMMTTSTRATFDNFDKLNRLLRTEFHDSNPSPWRDMAQPTFGTDAHFNIALRFQVGTPTPLDDIRISVLPLILATSAVLGEQTITIKLQAPNHSRCADTIIQHSFTIRHLRRIVIDALEQFVRIDCTDWRARCPQIWINGCGEVADVVATGKADCAVGEDPAEIYPRLWSAAGMGIDGGLAPPCAGIDGLARSVFLYLKWISLSEGLGGKRGKGEV